MNTLEKLRLQTLLETMDDYLRVSAPEDETHQAVWQARRAVSKRLHQEARESLQEGPVPSPVPGGGFAYERMEEDGDIERWVAPTATDLARICPFFSDADTARLATDEGWRPDREQVTLKALADLSATEVPTWVLANGGWSRIDLPGGRKPEEMLGVMVTITHIDPKES